MGPVDPFKALRTYEGATPGPWGNYSWSGRCNIDHAPHGGAECKYDYTKSFGGDWERCVSAEGEVSLISFDDWGPVLNAADARHIARWDPETCREVVGLLEDVESMTDHVGEVEQDIAFNAWRKRLDALLSRIGASTHE